MKQDAVPRPGPAAPPLDRSVAGRLHMVGLRLRCYVVVEGIARVVVFLFAAAVFQLLLDYGSRGLQWSMRVVLTAVIAAGAGRVVWRRVVFPLRLRIDPAEMAHVIERRYPRLSGLLVSAVRFSSGEFGSPETNSPALVAAVVERAGQAVRAIDFNTILDPKRARRSAMALLAVSAICVGTAAAWPVGVGLWFERNVLLQNVDWPKRTRLVVELKDGVLIGARGDDLVVQAHAEGIQPREVEFVFESESGKRGRETMATVGSPGSYRYRYTFKSAEEDFEFYLQGGDDRTARYPAKLLERPRVVESAMNVVPPSYSGVEPFTLGDGQRSGQVLLGTELTIRARTNKPVKRAFLMAGSECVGEARLEGDRQVITISPSETHTYHFALLDEAGLENRRPVTFSVRVLRDEPPRAKMKLPEVGDMITAEAVLPVELEFADDYGLATAELVYQISRDEGEGEGRLAPLSNFKPRATAFAASVVWSAAAESLRPGEAVTLFARATDFDTVSGPNLAQSPERTLRVVTGDELLNELRRREQELRMDFEGLVERQEQIRGRLLTALGRRPDGGGMAELSGALSALERRQRNVASSVRVIRQRFEHVFAELQVNQLNTREEEERLGAGIIEPLTRLVNRDLVAAADAIRQWSREGSADKAVPVDPQQVAVLSQMRAVLATMIQWEGYHEVVEMLRDIIRLQNELTEETKETLLREADEVFDD